MTYLPDVVVLDINHPQSVPAKHLSSEGAVSDSETQGQSVRPMESNLMWILSVNSAARERESCAWSHIYLQVHIETMPAVHVVDPSHEREVQPAIPTTL